MNVTLLLFDQQPMAAMFDTNTHTHTIAEMMDETAMTDVFCERI
jgi:hypothetical protein